MFTEKAWKEKRGKFVQMFLDVVAVSVDMMSIYLGVLLATDRYFCGIFFPKFLLVSQACISPLCVYDIWDL